VYFDPAATMPDNSDAEWAFVTSWVPLATFKREYPDSKFNEDALEFADLVREQPEWVRGEGETEAVLVAEYYCKKHTLEEIGKGKHKRKRDVVTVDWCKMTGYEVLDKQELNGKFIPLITVIGKELQPFDDRRRWTGIIGPAKDAQRLYNYAASSAVEVAALEPKAPYIGYAESIEGYEDEWQQSNVRNFPMLRINPIVKNGVLLPPPVRSQVDVGRLGPSMQLLQQADQFIQITTQTYDPGLGRESSRDKSGKAIVALQQQGEAGSSHYMHNLADISMHYEARVILDLIPKIYDRPGRLARTLNEEGESEEILLNAPFYNEPETKRPVALQAGQQPPGPPPPPGMPMGPGGPPPMPPGPGGPPGMGGPPMPPPAPPKVKHYDLSKGIYSVAISIGKQRQTALQESADEIGQILQSNPQLMPLLGPIYFENRDFPGSKAIAELMKKVREKQFPGLDGDEDGQPTPEAMKTQIEQMGQEMEMMGEKLKGAIQALETDQVKTQATLQKTEMDNAAMLQKAEMDNQTKLALAEMTAEFKEVAETVKAALEGRKIEHDSEEKDLDREQKELDREHDAAKTLAAPSLEFRGSNSEPLRRPPEGKEL